MGFRFEFSYLGNEHCYVASVTPVSGAGYSIGPARIACFRLPAWWTEIYKARALTQYISNIRGHDFLSYVGRWASEDDCGNLKASKNIINEIEALRVLGQENERRRFDKAELKLCLGPYPGSYFADAFELDCYDWADNLPIDLSKALKVELSLRGHGKISGVAINALGGWVMHFDEDGSVVRWLKARKQRAQFRWGGVLSEELIKALEGGQDRGAKISHVFLNHQHPSEYVLLFNDGHAYVNLHYEFEEPIRKLLVVWYEKALKKKLMLHFTYPCRCSEEQQKKKDAAYYSRRGRFHLTRGNSDLALSYLREAINQDPDSKEIRDNLRLALVAARLWNTDPVLEEILSRVERELIDPATFLNPDQSATGLFRTQYLSLVKSKDFKGLEAQLIQLTATATGNGTSHSNSEWSYSLACGKDGNSPTEIAPRDLSIATAVEPSEIQELPGSLVVAPVEAPGSRLKGSQHATYQRRPSELGSDGAVSPSQTEAEEEKVRYWIYK